MTTNKTPLFLFTLLLFSIANASAGVSSKIHPWVYANTAGGTQAEFFIVLKEKADLSPAFQMSRKLDRGQFVYKNLYETAQRSQAPLQKLLKSRGIEFQSFYIVNAILVKGTIDLAEELAARDDVDRIEGNPVIRNDLPEPQFVSEPKTPEAVEWSIDRTNAPDLWALGFTGQGIVIGGADTGYRWSHNALKSKYRGWDGTTASHDYNWHDSIHSGGGGSCGVNATAPCDDNGHGTHTMGTVVGDDGGSNQVGMAPGAKWIGCRNMNQGNGTPATYMECFEFFLAPYPVGGNPSQGDPALAPDLTTNSWSCPPSEGCSGGTLQMAVQAQEAAGIMTVAAAQNSGPACGTINDPIGTYASSYTIGSTTMANGLSSFSSRGPADFTGLMKPSVVAPGSGVRSATNSSDSAYSVLSGTSMATPNVAGGVALLWSAAPAFRNNQDNTETLINDGATPLPAIVEACGGDYVNGPNNSWGHGLMDVLTSYNSECTPPAIPQNLASSITVDNEVSLTWDSVPSATNYLIFRGVGSCPNGTVGFHQIGSTNLTTFLDTAVASGKTYSYKVAAIVGSCASPLSTCTDETIPCDYSISPDNASYTAAGGTGTFDVTTGTGCAWTAVSNDTWIDVTGGGSGNGNGTVSYSVDPNPSSNLRSGTITAAGNTFTVNQEGTACTYSLTPTFANYTATGGSGTFDVTTPDDCDWTATTSDTWITIDSGSPGNGNGTVGYTVAVNPDPMPRNGAITVVDQTFTVNQEAATAPCTFCDDFEDGVPPVNWTIEKPSWNESGSNLVGTPDKKKAIMVATPIFSGCLNCTVQAQMQTSGGIGNKLWLLAWWLDKDNTIELLMKQESGRWVLKQRSGKQIVAKAKAIQPIAVGTVYTVSISYNGTQFQLMVDSNPVLTLIPGATVNSGTVGFQVKSTTGQFGEIQVN